MKYDLIINLDTNKLTFSNDIPEKIYKNSKEEKHIINSIITKLKNNFNDKNEAWMVDMQDCDPNFEGSDDYIRNTFKTYFFNMVIDMSLTKQIVKNAINNEVSKDLILENNENKFKSEILTDEDSDDNESSSNNNSGKD